MNGDNRSLIKRLRDHAAHAKEHRLTFWESELCEAVDEIERLRADLDAAKRVIENIVESEIEPRHAILREARDHLTGKVPYPERKALLHRIADVLGESSD